MIVLFSEGVGNEGPGSLSLGEKAAEACSWLLTAI